MRLLNLLLCMGVTATALPRSNYKHDDQRFKWKDVEAVIAFGDSYTFVQGTPLGRANYSFIGDRNNLAFTPEQLLSSSIVQNGWSTSAGGPNWIEYLTGCGLQPGLTKPHDCPIQLWDFAFAGANIGDDFLPPHHNYTTSFQQQITQFLTHGLPVISPLAKKSSTLIASWIGINDISDAPRFNLSTPKFYSAIQTAHFNYIHDLYTHGYKNFLFLNLPPLHLRPGSVNTPNPVVNETMITWFNTALTTAASNFTKSHPDATVKIFDVYTTLLNVLKQPGEWAFKNTTGICPAYNQPDVKSDPGKYGCLRQEEYFWFDVGHIGWRVHEILAGALGKWLGKEFC